jgi:hypothetical protein
MPKKPKVGRPRRAGKVADDRITIRATAAERRAWERAAGEQNLSDWIRAQCNAKAGF